MTACLSLILHRLSCLSSCEWTLLDLPFSICSLVMGNRDDNSGLWSASASLILFISLHCDVVYRSTLSLHIQVFQIRDKVFIIQVSEVRIFKFKCKKIKLKNLITTTFSFSLNSLFGPLCFRLKYIHNSSMDCHEIWYRYLRPYAFSVPLTIHTIIRWFDLFNTWIYNHKKQLMKSAWCTGTSCKWAN